MADPHQLGGARQSAPLEDEMTYPLTTDEFLTLKENLVIDKFTNSESFLLSTFFTTLISGIVICFTSNIYKTTNVNNIQKIELNIEIVITIIVYGAITLGSLLCFIFLYYNKNNNKNSIQRLEAKITNHLEKQNS
ncbi:hypothetical protein [Flavobacterium sp.]|uniref:hypothetical protein n=1 Tax=Flavobacterium sp. TaxID=239 RepID=UPI004048858C